ncbi:MAG: DUF2461 domain-containing protein [Flavobacteriales bacterium]|nr:DUF2461 domain-containing protein [Flavobacteriales bacterium]MBL0036477.1 DUF2461 domain-containing protein [Flavobacteriales bacterium]
MATPPSPRIDRATFAFLSDLEGHNDRDWFLANKDRYVAAQTNVQVFVDALIERMKRHDRIATDTGKEALQRIYTDQRFHKDRPPYKPRFAGGLGRVKPALRGGYFFRFQPGGRSQIICGFMGPEAADLKRIRTDIAQDHKTWQRLLNAKVIRTNFGTLQGAQLRTAPRGFGKDHPAIDLLRRTQFLLRHELSDKEVLAPDLLVKMEGLYRSVRPLFDHMSEVLTTDADGNSLLRAKR